MAERLSHESSVGQQYIVGDGRKARRERADRGFATDDVWSFDTYLAGLIGAGLRELAKPENMHGCPPELCGDGPDGVDEGVEKWKAILAEMAEGFEWYVQGKFEGRPYLDEKYERSFDLFRQWFGHLWD